MNDTSPSTLFDYYPRSDSTAAPRASGSNLLPVSPRRPAHSLALAPHAYSVLNPRSEPFMQPFAVPSYLRHARLFSDRFATAPSDPTSTKVGAAQTLHTAGQATATDYKGKFKQATTLPPSATATSSATSPVVRDPILLPTCWNKDDACALLELTSDALGASFAGSAKNGDRDAAAVRANRPVPNQAGVYYFEVKILDKGVSGYIGIGLCQRSVSMSRLPGWEDKSYGYHADDGRAFCCQGTGEPFGPVFTTGDIIGCGIDWTDAGPPRGPRERTGVKSSARDRERERSAAGSGAADKDKDKDKAGGGGRVFFTKNGQFIDYAFCNLQGTLYPTIGLRTPNEAVRANFGAEPFAFDIESLVLERKRAVLARLATLPPPSYIASPSHFLPSPVAASTPPIPALLPPSDRERLHETIQSLVSGYLHHHGFGGTAERFEKQLKEERRERAIGLIPSTATDSAATAQGDSNRSTEPTDTSSGGNEAAQLATYRAEVRSALLSGTAAGAERALRLIESHFPAVLASDSATTTTTTTTTTLSTAAGVNKVGANDALEVVFRLKCRVFVEAAQEWSRANRDPAGMEHSTTTAGGKISHVEPIAAPEGDEDTAMMSSSVVAGDPPSAPSPSASSPLTLDSLLSLGQSLHAEYGSDPRPRVREELQAVLGLMAYRDPEKEATGRTAELLAKSERENLVDQVNRAVMRASGLPPVPALEALFRHATASIQLAAELGSGGAAMIDLRAQVLGR